MHPRPRYRLPGAKRTRCWRPSCAGRLAGWSRNDQSHMDADALRALQAPLKERYRAQPESALVTLSAQGDLGAAVSCRVETGRALVEAGLHPATGGTGQLACSGDMLLQALVACAGVTMRAVAT